MADFGYKSLIVNSVAEGVILLFGGILQAVSRSILVKRTPETKEDIADLHKMFRKILATYQPRSTDHTFGKRFSFKLSCQVNCQTRSFA